jgi:hypothetical protein
MVMLLLVYGEDICLYIYIYLHIYTNIYPDWCIWWGYWWWYYLQWGIININQPTWYDISGSMWNSCLNGHEFKDKFALGEWWIKTTPEGPLGNCCYYYYSSYYWRLFTNYWIYWVTILLLLDLPHLVATLLLLWVFIVIIGFTLWWFNSSLLKMAI